jgi:hypothetical protein
VVEVETRTMTQERLSGLATIALESNILEKINYNAMIKDFYFKKYLTGDDFW